MFRGTLILKNTAFQLLSRNAISGIDRNGVFASIVKEYCYWDEDLFHLFLTDMKLWTNSCISPGNYEFQAGQLYLI